MKEFFSLFQRIKFKLGMDRKNFILNYAKSQKVTRILEIGVFNGNFAERLLTILAKNSPNSKIYYLGVDLFADRFTESIYVSEVSLHPESLSNVQKKLSKFNNVTVELIEGDSAYVLPRLKNKQFDLIHIDGGHSYDTVSKDWNNVSKLMKFDTAVFFDDYTNLRGIAKGNFGVNNVVDHIDAKIFDIKLSLNRDFFWKEYGLLILRMVKVTFKTK